VDASLTARDRRATRPCRCGSPSSSGWLRGAAVVLREQLNVLVVLPSVDLVLDAVVREVDLAIEVRQIVFARPVANLALVAVEGVRAVAARGDSGRRRSFGALRRPTFRTWSAGTHARHRWGDRVMSSPACVQHDGGPAANRDCSISLCTASFRIATALSKWWRGVHSPLVPVTRSRATDQVRAASQRDG
jgi:hypothetical protein